MKISRIFSFSLCLILLTFSVSGCSMFGKGKKGEGDLSEADLNAAREARFGEGSIPRAEGEGLFRDVHFDYDSYELSDAARQNLESNAEILKQQSGLRVMLEGHCDERGTAEYNLALGAQRSKAVMNALVALGLPRSALETISYGEEVPLAPGKDESAFSKNRRVHFSAYKDTGSR